MAYRTDELPRYVDETCRELQHAYYAAYMIDTHSDSLRTPIYRPLAISMLVTLRKLMDPEGEGFPRMLAHYALGMSPELHGTYSKCRRICEELIDRNAPRFRLGYDDMHGFFATTVPSMQAVARLAEAAYLTCEAMARGRGISVRQRMDCEAWKVDGPEFRAWLGACARDVRDAATDSYFRSRRRGLSA